MGDSQIKSIEKKERRKAAGKLAGNALAKFFAGLAFIGLLLFLPAGSFTYYGAWLCIALLFVPMLIFGCVLLLKAPGLLRKRLNSKENAPGQKWVVALSSLLFAAGFVLAGLDFRFGWTPVSRYVSIAASVVMLAAYAMYMEVMRENAYLSRTVEIQEGQKVIDTGLYGVVRHPMYTSTVLLFLAIPLVLGSWIAFGLFFLYPVVIVFRIRGEERVLEEGLAGYAEYKKKVKYRLIPFVW